MPKTTASFGPRGWLISIEPALIKLTNIPIIHVVHDNYYKERALTLKTFCKVKCSAEFYNCKN